jgi:CrcB protein
MRMHEESLMWAMTAAVAAGGAVGSVLRFLVTQQMLRYGTSFPYGTLLVNVVGSLLIGLFARMFMSPDANVVTRAALTVGFCGGFTTFSTYSAELILLLEQGRTLRALVYMLGSTSLALVATLAGLSLGARLVSR